MTKSLLLSWILTKFDINVLKTGLNKALRGIGEFLLSHQTLTFAIVVNLEELKLKSLSGGTTGVYFYNLDSKDKYHMGLLI